MTSSFYLLVAGLFVAGAVLTFVDHALHGSPAVRRRTDWIKYGVFLLLIVLMLLAPHAGRVAVAGLLGIIAATGSQELSRYVPKPHRLPTGMGAFVVIALGLGHLVAAPTPAWERTYGMTVLFVTTADAFSQLWGRILGRHRLCPALSPKKTVEGLLGGLATAVLVGCLLGHLLPDADSLRLGVLGLLTALGGVGGDLFFSAIKRRFVIKDFAGLIPGHGGVLDRFDSLIVAAPICYWSRICLMA